MRSKNIFLTILLLTLCFSSRAEEKKTIFVSGTSTVHPYERGQWSIAECEAWQKKYGVIRGLNCPHPPCGAVTRKQSHEKAAALGYNSVRWWPGGITADSYIKNVESLAAELDALGMTLSPVFGFVYDYYNYADKAKGLKALEETVRKVIQHFRNDDRIILWDIWNEPAEFDNTDTPLQMEWIKQMVKWCREEGCTQPITASIVWDSSISQCSATGGLITVREEAEKMMDLHNFHDYGVQEGHNNEVQAMVNRYKRMDGEKVRPLVCTECMIRTSGSTYARTLTDFSKYNINFYSWGLYTCDANWEVRWGRSCWYAWEPMFHNALYADGEPYNESEPQFVTNFHFAEDGEATDPGAEYTERWASRRAWKWMSRKPTKGHYCATIADAKTFVSQHASDNLYNSISVQLKLSDYQANANTLVSNLESLLSAANNAGITVLPIFLENSNFKSVNLSAMQNYIDKIISKYYCDRRIMGWNIFQQTSDEYLDKIKTYMPKIFRYIRYQFPNQPMFATPMIAEEVTVDTTAQDFSNLLWKLSDVTSCNVADGANISSNWIRNLALTYERPLFLPVCNKIPAYAAANHVNCYTTGETEANVKKFDYTPFFARDIAAGKRWPAWKAWMWMNRGETKGLSASSVDNAINLITVHGSKKIYNSIRVALDFNTYKTDSAAFYKSFDNLLAKAEAAGMTVLPSLMTDKYVSASLLYVKYYTEGLLTRYADDKRIAAWDLYYKPNASTTTTTTQKLDAQFAIARRVNPSQPVFATPTVTMDAFATNYDYIEPLEHGNTSAGWNKLKYGSSNVSTCYSIWCRSDVIAYPSNLKKGETGWLNYVAYCFGRPIFCAEWQPNSAEEPTEAMKVFDDSHVNWYVNGTVNDNNVKNFHFTPVSTAH